MKSSTENQVLICSGLDPCGGAGFIADCRVVTANGARPIGVVTAHTVQNSLGVTAVQPLNVDLITAQLGAILSDTQPSAVKIGMLGNLAVAAAVVRALLSHHSAAPVIWDPVLRPTRGGVVLYDGDLGELLALFSELAGLCHVVVTPNTAELALLSQRTLTDSASMSAAASMLTATSMMSVLVKGGHQLPDEVDGSPQQCTDWLFERANDPVAFHAPYITTHDGGIHGTGCALSSALAAHMAAGAAVAMASAAAKRWVHSQMQSAVRYGRGALSIV